MASDSLNDPVRIGAGGVVTALGCAALLGFGLWIRDESYLRAESGVGYALGITGAATMLLLLGYSARKRLRFLSRAGPLSAWFKVHMALGLAGPIAILFHANFGIGSLNATMALGSMLLVAGSGIAGRFIYTRIHYGLYGRRLQLAELRAALTEENGKLRPLLEAFPEVVEPLRAFERRHAGAPRGSLSALWRLATLRGRARRVRRSCEQLLEPVLFEERAAAAEYVHGVTRIAAFSAWERLFRLWHAVHVPLFVLMVLTLLVHVVAVHMY